MLRFLKGLAMGVLLPAAAGGTAVIALAALFFDRPANTPAVRKPDPVLEYAASPPSVKATLELPSGGTIYIVDWSRDKYTRERCLIQVTGGSQLPASCQDRSSLIDPDELRDDSGTP